MKKINFNTLEADLNEFWEIDFQENYELIPKLLKKTWLNIVIHQCEGKVLSSWEDITTFTDGYITALNVTQIIKEKL